MKKLESIMEFKEKHPEAELQNLQTIEGGSLSHQDRNTEDNKFLYILVNNAREPLPTIE